ncbi:MAG: carboxypeptidase regulatory-like domain-containing protein [Acidobacteriota bacterium]
MRKKLFRLIAIVCIFSFVASTAVFSQAASITGTVKDPAGAVIQGAQVSLRNEATGETRAATTDDQGRFKFERLSPGRYTLTFSRAGFKTAERNIIIEGARVEPIEIKLEVAAPDVKVDVSSKGEVAPNTEPNYRALRDGSKFESYAVSNLTIKRDVGVITLRSGRISFLPAVMGRVVKAVFTGDGEFALTPQIALEKRHMRAMLDKESLIEPFAKAVFIFTDGTYEEIKRQSQPASDQTGVADLLKDFNERVRDRYALENIDAQILADIYGPKREGCFDLYMFGKSMNDLRYFVRPRGISVSDLIPEEVALINADFNSDKGGIIYLAHFESEYQNGKASSQQDHRFIDIEHYRIETVIDGSEKLTARADLTFTALSDGERVLGFGLLPALRVTRMSLADRDIHFIQESRKQDGSAYAVFPEPLVRGRQYKLTIEYQGDRVIEDAGGGNFAVGARTSWYPSVNAFTDRATYELTFKVPKKYSLIGVGKLVKSWTEGDFAASQWISEVPLAVAGFNYGSFKKKEVADKETNYMIEGYATSSLPSYLAQAGDQIGGMTPTRLLEGAMVEAQNSMRIFSLWFGEAPYGRIAITQQPQFNFGQSWPSLVYLPIISFFDSTQRWMLFGRSAGDVARFIQVVTPHEVAHQWWGHIVGWSSFHDQWLSEGIAEFSASVYLHLTEQKPDKFLKFWEQHRKTILEKNQWGRSANDAGPIWMGFRLITFKNPGAYNDLVYPKGAYILHMLRWMMYDRQNGDQRFIAMMKDFVKSHFNQNASTESFKSVVERHMTQLMDLDGNKKMDWFFNQWVYGTEVPKYRFEYSVAPESDGKFLLKFTLTQSGVSEDFKMLVPVYLDIDGKMVRLGQINITGNSTTQELKVRIPVKPKRVLINAWHDVLAHESVSVQK